MMTLSWILFALVLFRSYQDPALGRTFLLQTAYPLTLLSVLIAGASILPWVEKWIRGKSRTILLCALLAATTFIAVPPGYRVLSDETNLLSVSQSMHRERSILNVTEAKAIHGNLQAIHGGIPTRPLLFPFLVSLIHSATGYRYQNVFFLNFLILIGLLTLLWIPIENKKGRSVAFTSCLLILSIPTLLLSASSAGFDLCALFFMAFAILLLQQIEGKPSPDAARAFLPALFLLSQVRYESIAYALILGLILISVGRTRFVLTHTAKPVWILLPWFFLPLLLQRIVSPDSYENPPGVPPFAFIHFLRHGGILLQGLLAPRPDFPYPSILNLLSLGLGVLLGVLYWRNRQKKSWQLHWSSALWLIPVMNLLIVLSHHFGIFSHPTQARLFLPFLTSLSLIPLWFHFHHPDWLSKKNLMAVAVCSCILYLPVASEGRFTRSLTSIRETSEGYRFLEHHADPRSLLITSHPGQYTVSGQGAFGFHTANQRKKIILDELKRGLLSRIWVFQKHAYATGRPIPGEELDPAFPVRPVQDLMITPESFLRISQIDPVEAPQP